MPASGRRRRPRASAGSRPISRDQISGARSSSPPGGSSRPRKAQIIAAQAQVQAAEVALTGVREEARVGQRTTLDVLNAQQELLNARVNLITAQRDRVVFSYAVVQAMGASDDAAPCPQRRPVQREGAFRPGQGPLVRRAHARTDAEVTARFSCWRGSAALVSPSLRVKYCDLIEFEGPCPARCGCQRMSAANRSRKSLRWRRSSPPSAASSPTTRTAPKPAPRAR